MNVFLEEARDAGLSGEEAEAYAHLLEQEHHREFQAAAPTAGYRGEGGPDCDWAAYDARVDVMTPDELRAALKREARLRADAGGGLPE